MSQIFGQDANPDSTRSGSGVTAPFGHSAHGFQGNEAEQPSFAGRIGRGLRLHRRMVVAFASSGLVLAVAYLIASWSSYTAQALIYIQPTTSALRGEAPAAQPLGGYETYFQQQLLNIAQEDVLVGALHQLVPGVWQQRGESDEAAADRLKRSIEIARIGSSDQISVTAHAPDAETAAALANAVAASYVQSATDQQKAGDAEQLAAMRDQRDRIKKELDDDLAEQSAIDAHSGTAAGNAAAKKQRSIELAGEIARLQNLDSDMDEEIQGPLFESNSPGTARLAAAATVPAHPDVSEIASHATALLLAFVFLGLAAAMIAHKLDQRVFIAAEVEKLLGVAPMAQLPDFSEVSGEVADVHLLRLAAAFDYACKKGRVKSCLFTGMGPGTGVTTVTARLKERLETIGREALLVDAAGSSSAVADGKRGERENTEPGKAPITLLQNAAGQGDARRDELVFADTAPLAVSAETECLARFADCVIVVIESGVTTRTQLRRMASMLQRLNLNAVGFVLNRVRLAKADAAYRNSIREIEEHLRTQGRSTDWQTIRSRYFMAESVRVAAEAQTSIDAATNQNGEANGIDRTFAREAAVASGLAGKITVSAPGAHQTSWQPDDMPIWLTEALARFEAAHSMPGAQAALIHDLEKFLPEELTDAETDATDGVELEGTPNEMKAHSNGSNGMLVPVMADDSNQSENAERAAADTSTKEEAANGKKSRLSGLRGIVSAEGLKGLEQGKRPAEPENGTAAVAREAEFVAAQPERWSSDLSGLSRLRGIVSATNFREFGQPKPLEPLNGNGAADHMAPVESVAAHSVEPRQTVPEEASVSYPLPDSSLTGPGGNRQQVDEPQAQPVQPEHVSPNLAADPVRDLRNAWEAIQILPSRRGQYRKGN